MKKINLWLLMLPLIFILAGCKNNSAVINCPNLALESKEHRPHWAKSSANSGDLIHQRKTVAANIKAKTGINLLANADAGIPVKIKLPAGLDKKLAQGDEFEQVNKIYDANSDHQVKLIRNKNGHAVFTASSLNAVIKLFKTMKATPTPPAAPGGGGGFAIAGGILGIIGLLLALGPYVGFASFLFGLLAIIFGAIGLHSFRRGWAITGIVLGVLAIVVGAALTGVYVVIFHF